MWNEAEQLIYNTQHADIFLILDCCHAGKLLSARQKTSWSDRIFEFLDVSGPEQTTPLPRADSFSSALTWALKELTPDGCFMSSELLEKILNAPRFPQKGQFRGPHLIAKTGSPTGSAHQVPAAAGSPVQRDGDQDFDKLEPDVDSRLMCDPIDPVPGNSL
jgi:hypothetical protein